MMHRLRQLDCTTATIRAQLFPREDIIQHQAGVGLYDGKEKDDRYPDGTLYLTSHRLIYVDTAHPHRHSCFLDICLIRQTEYWVGFLKSSPKITLLLGDPAQTSAPEGDGQAEDRPSSTLDPIDILNHPATSHWACRVCGFSNSPGPKCGLCGVPQESASAPRSTPPSLRAHALTDQRVSRSLPRSPSNAQRDSWELADASSRTSPQQVEQPTKEIACPTCTFLNHPSMARCEICDSALGTVQLSRLTLNQPSDTASQQGDVSDADPQHSRAATPAPPASFPSNAYIRLSFRKGGDKSFYYALKKALQSKSWLQALRHSSGPGLSTGLGAANGAFARQEDGPSAARAIGIDGILKKIDSKQQAHEAEMTDGLRDLQALMTKAKEMVQMAQDINAKLTVLETAPMPNDAEPSEQKTALIRGSLLKLGLPAPAVTADMLASDQAYAEELAKELGGLLTSSTQRRGAIMSDGSQGSTGIRSLDEVWCMWNRARGVSLVSPTDMLAACQHLPAYTSPEVRLQTFRSGLRVLHTPHFGPSAFGDRTVSRLRAGAEDEADGPRWRALTTLEVAQAEGIAVSLAREMLEMVEGSEEAPIVRDWDARTGIVNWYPNLFSPLLWTD